MTIVIKIEMKKKEKDNRKTTDSYTGGKSSGIAVMNPEDEMIKKMKRFEDREKYDKTKDKLKLELYKNGFILDGGEFRDKNEPQNKKFMEEIEKGYIPKELVKKGYTDLGLELDDHRNEKYEPPKEEKNFMHLLVWDKAYQELILRDSMWIKTQLQVSINQNLLAKLI